MTKTAASKITAAAEQFSARAVISAGTFNKDARTVEVTFGTEAPVTRWHWDMGKYMEILDFNPKSVKMERMTSKAAPVLDSHDRWAKISDGGVIGVIESASIENKQGRSLIRFAKTEQAQRVMDAVEDGIVNYVSVGYNVHEYTLEEKGDISTYRATLWEPMEISFEKMPADINAGVRTEQGKPTGTPITIMVRGVEDTPVNGDDNQIIDTKKSPDMDEKQNPPVDEAKVRNDAVAAERQRVTEINEACAAVERADLAADFITKGTDINGVRAALLVELTKRNDVSTIQGAHGDTKVGADRQRAQQMEDMANGMALRAAQKITLTGEELHRAKRFQRGITLEGIAREVLELSGVNTRGLNREEIFIRAIATGDFPVLLENTLHKVLANAYAAVPDTWSRFCAVGSVSDFRAHNRYYVGGIGDLPDKLEGGEFKNLTLADGKKESIKAKTKGGIVEITREMLINDDLNAFMSITADLGRAAARTIESAVYAALALNSGKGPTMSDGKALFHVDHGNISTAAALSVAALNADYNKMQEQKDINGHDYLALDPAVLLVPHTLRAEALVLNDNQYEPTANMFEKKNTVRGLFKDIVATPRRSGTARILFADPSIAPVLEVAFLDGIQTPFMEMDTNFRTDGIAYKARLDFGVAGVGYKGAVWNAGA